MSTGLRTTVAMIVFNRPETTARVLDAVRAARPRRLLVVADGPRAGNKDDPSRCQEVRALFDGIDWKCDIERNFSPVNMGCRNRPASGLDWVFERAEEAIILEDDCLPDPSFFRYCEELLDRFRHEPRVMMITGNNFQAGRRRGDASYYFSRFPHIWGWASWRRAWRYFDVAIRNWPEMRRTDFLRRILGSDAGLRMWEDVFDRAYRGQIPDAWDYQWTYAVWTHDGLAATPNVNLVSNIGGGAEATHTKRSPLLGLPTRPLHFPMTHPTEIAVDQPADAFVQRRLFTPSLRGRVAAVLRRAFLAR